MDLVILHHHLSPGGVTQVVVNHVRALDAACEGRPELRIIVLYGDGRGGWPEHSFCARLPQPSLLNVPGLSYDRGTAAMPARLARGLLQRLNAMGCHPGDTIIHAHNHALGKNISLPGALVRLSHEGYRLLLQIHDFVEDFRLDEHQRLIAALCPERPGNLSSALYPQASNIHYAVLNRRDHSILGSAGVRDECLHLLPNPVPAIRPLPSTTAARQRLAERFGVPAKRGYILYPVRCIRRKNIGEALLWSLLAGEKATVGFTLPPLNPVEQPIYRWWKRVASELALPCIFETGTASDFSFNENLACADRILSTSVAEGFGMVFLEAWLAGRPLIGRDLPEITADFIDAGIRLDGMRPQMRIPLDWIGSAAFRSAIGEAYRSAVTRYDRALPPQPCLERRIDVLEQDGRVDFARLPAALQGSVLGAIRRHPNFIDRLKDDNPWVVRALAADVDETLVRENAAVVREHYSSEQCGGQLFDVYETILAGSPDGDIRSLANGSGILDAFLELDRFHPIRTENHG